MCVAHARSHGRSDTRTAKWWTHKDSVRARKIRAPVAEHAEAQPLQPPPAHPRAAAHAGHVIEMPDDTTAPAATTTTDSLGS